MQYRFAFVLVPIGSFGGAQRRFTILFKYLYEKYPINAYYIVSYDLYCRILDIFPNYPVNNLIIVGPKERYSTKKNTSIAEALTHHQNIKKNYVYIKKVFRFIKSIKKQFSYYIEIENIRKKYKIDLFVGVYAGILPLYFYLQRINRKVGIVFSNMDSWFSNIIFDNNDLFLQRYVTFNYAIENCDYLDFLSPFILEGIKARGIKINEENLSVAVNSFTDYDICRLGDKRTFKVTFAGRLEKDKNPGLFLEAAEILINKYPDIHFYIMGEGRLSKDIKDRVDKVNSNRILFYGFHPAPTEILAESSVFVSIQTTNNYPSQSVLEAMACGCAIVATDVGDTRMFINNNNGILINLRLDELVSAIEKLYIDSGLAVKLGNFAYNYVREKHTIENMANYYISIFEKVYKKIN